MTAVLLAAGLSTRLRPQTIDLPKPLIPVGGTPLLSRALTALHHSGIRRVVLVTGFHRTMIEQFTMGHMPKPKPIFVDNPHYATTGNNYSLALAAPYMQDDEMLLLDGDILFAPVLLNLLLQIPDLDALLVRTSGELGEEEVKVITDSTQHISQIGKEIDPATATGESIGIAKFSRLTTQRLFRTLDARKARREFYEASFQEIVDTGTPIRAVPCEPHPCIEIDTPDDLAEAEAIATFYGL